MNYYKIKLIIHSLLLIVAVGCKKLITVPAPVTQLSSENVYSDNGTAVAVLTGVYINLDGGLPNPPTTGAGVSNIPLLCGLSADEFTLSGGSASSGSLLTQSYQNILSAGSSGNDPATILSNCYSQLYIVNLALERLASSNSLTPSVKQQLTGEAHFIRAFLYFYLVNLYGDVPLTTSSDYATNAMLARASSSAVYLQIILDLKDAQGLLSNEYVGSDAITATTERVRPNKWVATALLSRAYLYAGVYDSAELAATSVINNAAMYDTVSLDNIFLRNSKEAIWQLQPVNAGMNTNDAWIFILPPTGPSSSLGAHPVYLSPQLLAAFEPGDRRRTHWVDSIMINGETYSYAYKYKSATLNAPVTEYDMVLRLGEQYLIRAEARARRSNIKGAQTDLNVIRSRAGLPNTSANDQGSLLAAIAHERQVELFSEWGHRWLDLKRMGMVDSVMGAPINVCAQKGGAWSSNWQWYPLPDYDLTQDPNLVQNPGY